MNQKFSLVLMVEDNPAHKALIVRHMKYFQTNIDHVEDGQAALDYLFRRGKYAYMEASPLPDLIMLDLRLPKIDGLEVLREIKASKGLKHLPVVIVSSSKDPDDMRTAEENGAEDYLVKMLGAADFADQVELLVEFWIGKKGREDAC